VRAAQIADCSYHVEPDRVQTGHLDVRTARIRPVDFHATSSARLRRVDAARRPSSGGAPGSSSTSRPAHSKGIQSRLAARRANTARI